MSTAKFHLSLNVRDLRRTADFLELLLGQQPAALHADYAKFELADPPVVLSFIPSDLPPGGGLNHLGFRLPNHAALAALEARLAEAGIELQREESVVCCHSRQTKAWVTDPAGNSWELYVLEDEPAPSDAACEPQTTSIAPVRSSEAAPASAVWAHRLGQAIPTRIDAADASLDEIVLEGSLNARHTAAERAALLKEAARALRPGGLLRIRGLSADRPLLGEPQLPGPAAAVRQVPTSRELLEAVRAAGFAGIELVTFGETYTFSHAGAELRETRLQAWRGGNPQHANRTVIYRGPFAEVRDDTGTVLRRGEAARIDEATWQRWHSSGIAEQFVLLVPVGERT